MTLEDKSEDRSEDRRAVRNYLAHALDEFRLATFHAERLAWDEQERERVKAAFGAVRVQLVRLARELPAPHRCGSCRDTGKWPTGIECPACGGATLRPELRPELEENVDVP